MNARERTRAILHFQEADHVPVVHFGYWAELLDKWLAEGHITEEERRGYWDGSPADNALSGRLGFDFCYTCQFGGANDLRPGFARETLESFPDGSYTYRNDNGLIERAYPGVDSIPMSVGTTLTGREAWEELYKPKLTWTPDRVNMDALQALIARQDEIEIPLGLHVGSMADEYRAFFLEFVLPYPLQGGVEDGRGGLVVVTHGWPPWGRSQG